MSTTAEAGERKYKTLAANTALISFATVGSKLMVFFMVRFYTGYMSPADYGTADIITQTANLLIPLVSLGMAEGVFRFAALRPDKGREAFTAGLVCSIFGTALLAVFRLGITGYVLSVAAADAGCTLWLVLKKRLWRELTLRVSPEFFRRMLAYSVPLIPTAIFWWITGVSDRYMISGFLGSAANGIYSVSSKLPTMLTVLSTVFMDAWQLSAVTESGGDASEHRRFYSHIWSLFHAGVIICAALMIALSKIGIMLLADEEYFSAWRYVPALTLAMVCSAFSSFMGSVYTVTGESRQAFRTAMAGAVLNIALNLALIPSPLGVQGAAIATFVSCLAVYVIRAVSVRRLISFDTDPLRCALDLIIVSVQAAFIVLDAPLWLPIQFAAVTSLCFINRAPLMQCAVKIWGYLHPTGKHLKQKHFR